MVSCRESPLRPGIMKRMLLLLPLLLFELDWSRGADLAFNFTFSVESMNSLVVKMHFNSYLQDSL